MNWLKKIASHIKVSSTTFSIEGSHKMTQPMTVGDISYPMLQWMWNNIPHEIMQASVTNVTPDGREQADGGYDHDYSKELGIINIYIPEGTNPQDVVPYLEKYNQEELQLLGIEGRVAQINKSNLSGGDVIRFQITQNNTWNLERLPELNVSEANASAILEMLGIPFDYSGSVDAQELLSKISIARDSADLHTEEPEQDGIMFSGGRSLDQIERYFSALEQIANRALEMNNPSIVWG